MKKLCLLVMLLFVVTALFGCSGKGHVSSLTNSSSKSAAEIRLTFIEDMKAGKVSEGYDINSGDFSAEENLLQRYCENCLSDVGSVNAVHFLSGNSYFSTDDFELGTKDCFVSYTNKKGEQIEKYMTGIYGKGNGENNTVYLIDAFENNGKLYSFELVWEKIKTHAVFDKLIGTIPKTEMSSGLTEINLKAFIGNDRKICNTFKYSENIVAIVSAKTKYHDVERGGIVPNRAYLDDIRVDLFSVSEGKSIGKGHLLQSIFDKGYLARSAYYYYANSQIGELRIQFSLGNKEDETKSIEKDAYSVITIDDNYKMKDTLTIMSDEEALKSKIELEEDKVVSKSGRYQTFHKNFDLYIHDNTTGDDIRVFDAKPDDDKEPDSVYGYESADACTFEGDVLYYNVYGYEWIIGNGTFDANAKVNKLNKNGLAIDWIGNGYAYGGTSELDEVYYYGRFKLSEPNKIERLFDGYSLADSDFAYSDNNRLIARIWQPPQGEENNFNLGETSFVTMYDYTTFKKVEEYSLKSPFITLNTCMFMGDYLYIMSSDNQSAYKVKIK